MSVMTEVVLPKMKQVNCFQTKTRKSELEILNKRWSYQNISAIAAFHFEILNCKENY